MCELYVVRYRMVLPYVPGSYELSNNGSQCYLRSMIAIGHATVDDGDTISPNLNDP